MDDCIWNENAYIFSWAGNPLVKMTIRGEAVKYNAFLLVCLAFFYLLRQPIGDPAFWSALRDLYNQFLFKPAAWRDLQQIFERHTGRSLDTCFRQWVGRSGAPQLLLDKVRQASDHDGYRTIGRLVQTKPYYDISLDLALKTEAVPELKGPGTSNRLP